MNNNVASGPHDPAYQKAVYVFEAPVRLWHWTNALSIATLAVTGYLIANPLPSLDGLPSDHFLMGDIRWVHFIAAYVFAIGFAVRIYWAIVGNKYSREIFYLPVWRAEWWRGVWEEIKFYLFITRKQDKTLGHNPLAQAAMFFLNTLVTLFMICTGFALYGEGLGEGSWADRLFGWIVPLLGGPQATRNWHVMGMWILVTFVILHVYMAVRADIIGRVSSVSAMIGGWRMFKDDQP